MLQKLPFCSTCFNDVQFQAPGFYLKLGYNQFGETSDYEGGYKKHYFEKGV